MRFNFLGPIEVIHGDISCTPTAAKVRWILALLVMRGNRITDTAALVDELWGDAPPRSAVATVQSYVYQLRKALKQALGEAGVDTLLISRPPGYGLLLGDYQVDVRDFERGLHDGDRLLTAGEPAAASRVLTDALALWRGPVLADLRVGRQLQAHIAQLEEYRIRALELRVTADMALGRHRELVPELRSLVIAYPLNEWFHGALISALAGAGRRGEALQAYQTLRTILDEELGLEPSIPMQRLQRELLTGDPDWPVPQTARPVAC
jgi:DNA-binding SARP family transcriptional activator